MTGNRTLLLGAMLLAGLSLSSTGRAQDSDTIRMGALATLEGTFIRLGEDGIRGVELALQEFNYEIAGKKIELVKGSSDTNADVAVRAAKKLVEEQNVQILVGPVSGSEGIAVKNYAKTQPNVTFLNGASAAQDTTLRDPSENFFRFSTEGAQWMAGLGEYVYNVKGYRSIALIAEDYSFPYTMAFGFLEPFCRLGGKAPVDSRFWVPLGTDDYSAVIAAIPEDVDAIFVALGGTDAVKFLTQYEQSGGYLPLIGGTITVDQTVLGTEGRTRKSVIGTPSAGPISDTWNDPRWTDFVIKYKKAFRDGFPTPSLFAHAYYINTKAALLALQEVNGDLSDGGAKMREVLRTLEFDTPTGKVKLDDRQNGVANIFLTEVIEGPDGNLINRTIKVIPQVNQTLGLPYEDFLKYGVVGRENPSCE